MPPPPPPPPPPPQSPPCSGGAPPPPPPKDEFLKKALVTQLRAFARNVEVLLVFFMYSYIPTHLKFPGQGNTACARRTTNLQWMIAARRNFDLDKTIEIHYHSWKEHLKMS